MAKIYFNDSIIKHTKEPIILNWFSQKDGTTIFVRDRRAEIYEGINHIYGDLHCHKAVVGKDYYVDIEESKVLDGLTIMGLYVGEGEDFKIESVQGKEPIFIIQEKSFESGLGMQPSTSRNAESSVVTMGMFFLGTKVSLTKKGQRVTDELTKDGWERVSGPKDSSLGILTTSEAFEDFSKTKSKNGSQSISTEAVRAAVKDGVVPMDTLRTFEKRDKNRKSGLSSTYIFLKEDMEALKKGKYI